MTVIYALCCPDSGATRYVGKTKYPKTRLNAHISKAKALHTKHHCSAWIRSVLAKGKRPQFLILETVEDGARWEDVEAKWIAKYRTDGIDLTNGTGGGEGFHDVPESILKKRGQSRSKTLSDPAKRAEFLNKLNVGKRTDQAKANRSAAILASWADPVRREAMLRGMRTPEAVQRRSEATRRRMNDPAIADTHAAGIRERFKSQEAKDQLKRASLIRWANRIGVQS